MDSVGCGGVVGPAERWKWDTDRDGLWDGRRWEGCTDGIYSESVKIERAMRMFLMFFEPEIHHTVRYSRACLLVSRYIVIITVSVARG
jgi:hypothetical protein